MSINENGDTIYDKKHVLDQLDALRYLIESSSDDSTYVVNTNKVNFKSILIGHTKKGDALHKYGNVKTFKLKVTEYMGLGKSL
jgi:hypothetical protein